jgi:SulP family sulfate permease
LSDRLRRSGRTLVLCGARRQPAAFLDRAEFIEHVGAENVTEHVQSALERARRIEASRLERAAPA